MEIIKTDEYKIYIPNKELMEIVRQHIQKTTGTIIPYYDEYITVTSDFPAQRIILWVSQSSKNQNQSGNWGSKP